MTHDVCMASTGKAAAPHVLLTTKTKKAADEIVSAIQKNSADLFQCDGMKFFARESDREEKKPEPKAEVEATPVLKP